MAEPELSDGFIRVPNELDAAFAVAEFTSDERLVLLYARHQFFGMNKLQTAQLVASVIAKDWGRGRESVARAIRGLLRANVLVNAGDHGYRLNEDYKTWIRSGVPLLNAAEVEYCRNAAHQGGSNE